MEEYKAKISIDTKAATNSLNDLGNSIEGVSEELIPLTTQMGEMEDKLMLMAHAGDTSSAEFKNLSKQVAGMRKTVRETDAGIEALSMTTSGKLSGALGGVTAGFELATGAMGSMGVDSAEVEAALLKVQSAMAMAQGVQGIKEAVPAFKAMGSTAITAFQGIKGAIGATGIGLLVIAIGALYANFDKLGGLVDWAKEKFDGMGEGIKTMVKISMYPLILVIEGVMWALEELGIIESEEEQARSAAAKKNYARAVKQMEKEAEAAKARKQNFQNEQGNFDRLISLAEAEGKSTLGLQKQKIANSIAYQKEQIKEMELSIQAIKFVQEQTGWMAKGLKDIVDQAETDLNTMRESLKNSETELKVLDINARKEAQARAQEAKDAKLALLQEENDAKRELYVQDAELSREVQEEIDAQKLAAQEAAQEAALKSAQEYTLSLADLPQEEIAVEIEKFSKLEELQMKWATAMKTNRKEVNDGLVQSASDMFATLGNLAELFQGRSAKSQEKAFKVQKAAQIGQATIDTFKAATGAFSSMASIPVVGPVLGGIAAAAAVAAGLLNIKKIQATKFEGGSVPSGGGDAGSSIPSASSIMSPNFNIVGNNPVNQLAQLGAQPIQAYVVSGEVTTAQSLDRNRIKNATL
tara:strand:- start:765 stop:2681 length:1917 start_codon:yes stop_codon:yes gene_type:complete